VEKKALAWIVIFFQVKLFSMKQKKECLDNQTEAPLIYCGE
jgi:hypothetical protein